MYNSSFAYAADTADMFRIPLMSILGVPSYSDERIDSPEAPYKVDFLQPFGKTHKNVSLEVVRHAWRLDDGHI